MSLWKRLFGRNGTDAPEPEEESVEADEAKVLHDQSMSALQASNRTVNELLDSLRSIQAEAARLAETEGQTDVAE